jgi:hypothetical protein
MIILINYFISRSDVIGSKQDYFRMEIPIVRYAILVVVLAHIITTGLHDIAHQQAGVGISDFQSA